MATSRPRLPGTNPNNSTAAANGIQPLQYTQLTEDDLKNPGTFNTIFSQLFNQVNAVTGASGQTTLAGGVDVAGAKVSNVGRPTSPGDAVNSAHAEANYSAQALQPKLEAGGSHTLRTYRALNSKQQSEKYSTYLNQMSNTAPTTNTTTVEATSVGSVIEIVIPAGYHLRVDGSSAAFGTFTATVPAPTAQTIVTASRTGGVSTLNGTFSGLLGGESINVTGVSDPTFDGTFVLLSATGSVVTYAQPTQANTTLPATGGTIGTLGCYYFYLKYPSQQLAISGPFSDDSQQNRLASNVDGQVLIAVVVVNSDGIVQEQSAAGATPPAATGNFRLLARL